MPLQRIPFVPALLAALSLGSIATAQRSEDPASRTWNVVLNGTLNEKEHFEFVPAFYGDGTWGMYVNFEFVADGDDPDDDPDVRLWGFGIYFWNPVTGKIDYENRSSDGGGGQTGQYTWDAPKYVRNRSSHPEAPSLVLVPGQR
jgi:hypothetical protein